MTDNVTPPNAPAAPTGSVLDQLVGPDKKFKDVEALAKGKAEADNFVASLTRETKELRELTAQLDAENKVLRTRASIVDRLNGNPSEPQGNPPPQNPPTSVTPTKGLTAEDVVSVIEQREQTRLASQNRAVIDSTLTKVFGTDAVAAVKQRASELGMSHEELVSIGLRSPEAMFSMLGIQKQPGTGNPMYAGAPNNNPGKPANVRNYAWYEAKRKEMGNIAYLGDRNIQLQLHKDAIALGDDFYK